ncbi:MAG: hypothetical protein IJ386_04475 [Clostridia bacterium]|nr:hypothetical protein [Clostridia bacterium]
MKKLTALLPALCLVLVMAGCNVQDQKEPLQTTDRAVTTEPVQTTAEAVTTTVTTEPPEPVVPDQSHIGLWYTDESKTDDIYVYGITEDYVTFQSGIFRTFAFNATARLKNGEFVFETDDGIKGKIEFIADGVVLRYDSYGKWGETYTYLNEWPNVYKFTVRHTPTTDKSTVSGVYYYETELFNAEYRTMHPGHNPYISFFDDRTCVMIVGYGGGICPINGTYEIDGNKINVELDVENSFLGGIDVATGKPYMDNKYVFEIVDNDHIKIGPAPDSYYGGECYVVRAGGSFIRE